MNQSKFILETSPNRRILETLDVINRATDSSQGVSKSRLLLITLSTTIMMALKKPLSREYYQWTRAYLETIKNEDGTSLPNISKFLKYIDRVEKNHNIDDILQSTRISITPEEEIEIVIQEPSEDILQLPDNTILSSTKIPKVQIQSPENEEIEEEQRQNDADPEEEDGIE
ncbi:unnamed protein product [Chironomus riparius]|uniref:Uncharacterized protein n=1 Tax=Chironomus riparius TaxID=315576 RepID=A0A9N9WMA8_9DIPT|nr:unnamed protein product [Chironomus riparius]